MPTLKQSQVEIVIIGAGIIGLSLAAELQDRGSTVAIVEARRAMNQTSFAAAGMLAAHDPHNPAKLLPLAELSLRLYPSFLARLQQASGLLVPIQTRTTVQYDAEGVAERLSEQSIDPRQLASAVLAASRKNAIPLHEHAHAPSFTETANGIDLETSSGLQIKAKALVYTSGAWYERHNLVYPCKGQMMRVALPPKLRGLDEVHRTKDVYIVPRTQGPQAGTALIGATIEDVGFDVSTKLGDLAELRFKASKLLDAFLNEAESPLVDSWAGLRPATADGLPFLGAIPGTQHQFVATGHFRNGILLAPATAAVMADLVSGESGALDLLPFSVERVRTY